MRTPFLFLILLALAAPWRVGGEVPPPHEPQKLERYFQNGCRQLEEPIRLRIENYTTPRGPLPPPEAIRKLLQEKEPSIDVHPEYGSLLKTRRHLTDQDLKLLEPFVKKNPKTGYRWLNLDLEVAEKLAKQDPTILDRIIKEDSVRGSISFKEDDAQRVTIEREEAKRILGRSFNSTTTNQFVEKEIPIENLMSAFVKKWAHECAIQSGPNCFHAAIAAQGDPKHSEPKEMTAKELNQELEKNYTPLVATDKPRFGDVLVIRHRDVTSDELMTTHAAFRVGVNREKPDEWILFTKNGQEVGKYFFMLEKDVLKRYRSDFNTRSDKPIVTYYRLKPSAWDSIQKCAFP